MASLGPGFDLWLRMGKAAGAIERDGLDDGLRGIANFLLHGRIFVERGVGLIDWVTNIISGTSAANVGP